MHIILDGYAAGPNGELDWLPYDDETVAYADELVKTIGSAIYGRVTYQMMESHWPTVYKDPSNNSKHDYG